MYEASRDCRGAGGQAGFALIVAILALMLLTFLGLTMVATTSTELQIATNQRWAEQARYNAEAGIEAGKTLLRDLTWNTILPPARKSGTALLKWKPTDTPDPSSLTAPFTRDDQWGQPSRNQENWTCDGRGHGQGNGVVLDDGQTTTPPSSPYQYKDTVLGMTIPGTFTVWVRRVTTPNNDGTFSDSLSDDQLVLASEGTAPHTVPGGRLGYSRARDAVRVLEVWLARDTGQSSPCGTRGGQTSQGPEGAGFGCAPVSGEGVGKALGLGTLIEENVK